MLQKILSVFCLVALLATSSALAEFPANGARIAYGRYEQDGNVANGAEPIEWIVLYGDESRGRVLLLSRYILDARRFDNTENYRGWMNSDLRTWLNGEFANTAFTEEERGHLVTAVIKTPAYEGQSGGENVNDRIFLLSRTEVEALFKGIGETCRTVPTAYAASGGAYASEDHKLNGRGCGKWWLRSPGAETACASYVHVDGFLYETFVYSDGVGVRPGLWLDLNGTDLM